MSVVNTQIRELADRVAASHGLDVVDLEFLGGSGKHRTLRVFLERNAAGRAALAVRLEKMLAEDAAGSAKAGQAEEAVSDPLVSDQSISGPLVAEELAVAEEDQDEEELAYLKNLPSGVPMAQLSGITHGDCARFSLDFGTALDVEDLIPGAEYMLEASSPGLDRRLSRREDFERFSGQLCRIQTFTPVDGSRQHHGRLGAVSAEGVTLEPVAEKKAPRKKKGAAAVEPKPVEIALENIEKALLQPEF